MRTRATLVTAAAVVTLLAGVAIADWIELKNERRFQGEIVEESEDGIVTIRVDGGHVYVPRSAIVRTAAEPVADETREKVAHRGGALVTLGEYRYLDGWNAATQKVEVPTFTVLRPVGELAHGTVVRVEERRVLNGTEMARVKVGGLEGWVPAAQLRAAR